MSEESPANKPSRKDVVTSPHLNALDKLLSDLEIETPPPVISKKSEGRQSVVKDLTQQRTSKTLASFISKKKIKFKPIKQLVSLTGHDKNIFALAMSGNTFFSGGKDASIRAWDVSTAKESHCWTAHDDAVYSLAKTKSLLISGSWDKRIKLWDLNTFAEKAVLPGHNNYVSALCPVDENLLYSGGFDSAIQVDTHPSFFSFALCNWFDRFCLEMGFRNTKTDWNYSS